jgi:hypothetical protein
MRRRERGRSAGGGRKYEEDRRDKRGQRIGVEYVVSNIMQQ